MALSKIFAVLALGISGASIVTALWATNFLNALLTIRLIGIPTSLASFWASRLSLRSVFILITVFITKVYTTVIICQLIISLLFCFLPIYRSELGANHLDWFFVFGPTFS